MVDCRLHVTSRGRIESCNRFIGAARAGLSALRDEFFAFTRLPTRMPGSSYLIRSKTPKMGIYIAMIMEPMIAPMTTIMIGSMSDVSASVVASTSWS